MPKKWDDVPDGRRQTGAKSLGNRHFLLVEPLVVTGVSRPVFGHANLFGHEAPS